MYGFKPDTIKILKYSSAGLYGNSYNAIYIPGRIRLTSESITNIPGGAGRGKESGITAKIRVFDSSITMNDKIEFNGQVYPIKSIRPVKYFSRGLEYEVII